MRSIGTGAVALVMVSMLAAAARADTVTTTVTLFGEKWEWASEGKARTALAQRSV